METVRFLGRHVGTGMRKGELMAEILSTETFREKVQDATGTVLVDFFATWCGPCKMIAPAVEQLAEEYKGRAAVYKLDVDDAQEIGMEYKVMSIPTLIVFKDGQEAERVRGALSKAELADLLERNL